MKGELDLDKNVNSEKYTGKIVLHKGKKADNGEEITGFLIKTFGEYRIVLEEDDNTAYPVMEDSIQPCLKGTGLVEKPWNRWYVNEKMLPRLQDTVLICKGWYDKEKYHSEYEALRAYWATIAEVSVEDIGYDAVLQCLLMPACDAFLCNRKFCEIFYEKVFKNEICGRKMKAYFEHSEIDYRKMDAEYLIELLTGALFGLRNDEFSFEKRPEDGYCVV